MIPYKCYYTIAYAGLHSWFLFIALDVGNFAKLTY